MKFFGSIFLILSPSFLAWAIALAGWTIRMSFGTERIVGRIVDREFVIGPKRYSHAPVLEYQAGGRTYRITRALHTQPPRPGRVVAVVHKRDHLESGQIDTFGQRWAPPLMVGGGALLFLIFGLLLAEGREGHTQTPLVSFTKISTCEKLNKLFLQFQPASSDDRMHAEFPFGFYYWTSVYYSVC